MSVHIEALFEGQELSTEFKDKATSIFEAAVEEQTAQLRESIEAEFKEVYETKTEEKMSELDKMTESYIQEEIIPSINKYLTAAVSEWIEDNKVALQAGAKVDLAESFLSGLVGLAENHNFVLPEGQDTRLAELEEKVAELTEKATELTDKNIELQESVREFKKGEVVSELTSDLTESQKERISGAVAKVEFRSEDQFAGAVKSIIESYFPTLKEEEEEEGVDDEEEDEDEEKKPVIESVSYAASLLKQIL